jgi:hypothetical protein
MSSNATCHLEGIGRDTAREDHVIATIREMADDFEADAAGAADDDDGGEVAHGGHLILVRLAFSMIEHQSSAAVGKAPCQSAA